MVWNLNSLIGQRSPQLSTLVSDPSGLREAEHGVRVISYVYVVSGLITKEFANFSMAWT